jgi:hypothetical protein
VNAAWLRPNGQIVGALLLAAEVGGAGRATEAASVNYAAFLSSAAACASNSAA